MVEIRRRPARAGAPLAVVEKFFFYRSSTTSAVVLERGVVLMNLARLGIPMVEFPTMEINLTLAGSGHAEKHEMLEAVRRQSG